MREIRRDWRYGKQISVWSVFLFGTFAMGSQQLCLLFGIDPIFFSIVIIVYRYAQLKVDISRIGVDFLSDVLHRCFIKRHIPNMNIRFTSLVPSFHWLCNARTLFSHISSQNLISGQTFSEINRLIRLCQHKNILGY